MDLYYQTEIDYKIYRTRTFLNYIQDSDRHPSSFQILKYENILDEMLNDIRISFKNFYEVLKLKDRLKNIK